MASLSARRAFSHCVCLYGLACVCLCVVEPQAQASVRDERPTVAV